MIFNKWVDKGICPSCKKNRKIPLFKSGENSDASNYRHVFVQPLQIKFFEKNIHNQLSAYLSRNYKYILNNAQYGFTRGRSATDAVKKATEFRLLTA